uniref:Coproporphyrinogen III oxidase n=1 Tax=Prevotella sp. GTC17262 TaxID=3236797 RepID=A0AB33JN58_9BACT
MQNQATIKHTDVVVIGAGLTGLTTAYTLKRRGINVHVVEKMTRIGGQIQTHRMGDYIVESGPNTGVVSFPEVTELMNELKETSHGTCLLEPAVKAAKQRLIWKGNLFHVLPSSLIGGLKTPLFTWADKFRILGEPWRRKGQNPDESIASLAARRLGKSFVDYAVDPFISGVYAGDANKLITRYALPKLYNLEQDYGSFIRGAMAKAKQPKTERDRLATKEVFSAVGGLGQIPKAEADYIGIDHISLGATNVRICPVEGQWQVEFSDQQGQAVTYQCRQVITTCGAYELSNLLPFIESQRLERITNLNYAPIIEVGVGVRNTEGLNYKAFGGLIPSREQKKVLGILFPSACFKGRAPEGGALYTYFIGGVKHAEMLNMSDDELQELVEEYFHSMLKFPSHIHPESIHIFRHSKAIPQYEVSSGARFDEVARLESKYPGLIIAGNLRDGIGMAHRIKQARDIATNIQIQR